MFYALDIMHSLFLYSHWSQMIIDPDVIGIMCSDWLVWFRGDIKVDTRPTMDLVSPGNDHSLPSFIISINYSIIYYIHDKNKG